MANQVIIPIIVEDKTYNYRVSQVFCPPVSNRNVVVHWGFAGFDGDNMSINEKFVEFENYPRVSLFEFLEMPKTKGTTFTGSIADIPCTFTIVKKDWSIVSGDVPKPDVYGVDITLQQSGSPHQIFYEAFTGEAYLYAENEFGTGIAYDNYRNSRTFIIEGGGNHFRVTQVINRVNFGVRIYTGRYRNAFKLGNWSGSYELNTAYCPAYYSTQHGLSDRTALWSTSNFTTALNNKITYSGYPDDPDDPENPNDDPTDPTPSGGDTTSDPIPIPVKPTIDVTGTGFVTLYNPSATDIRQLAYFMWSGDFTDLLKKMFSAPFDCLIGLKLLYAPITTGASQTIWLGNVESTVSAPKITDQFTDFDCGTITLDGYFGSFLDYAPYTKVTIFLPFIGYKQLNVDEVMNAQLHLVYRVDAYSGACIAFLHVTKTIGSTNLSSVLYEFDGNCAMDIPFTSGDMSRYVSAILGTAASTAGAVISMGAGAKLATQSIPITANDPWTKNDFSNKQTVTGLSDLGNGSAELVGGKPQIQRGGSLAGANASMALKQPYIIIERPMQQMPADYATFIGIPLNMTKTLSQMSGFTVVSQVFMASSQATDDELDMINTLLRQGVII